MDIMQIINIVAIIIMPFLTIVATRKLQDRAELRKEKIEIYKSLTLKQMAYIASLNTPENEYLGNGVWDEIYPVMKSVPIIFQDSKNVIKALRKNSESTKTLQDNEDVKNGQIKFRPQDISQHKEDFRNLLLEMAKNLKIENPDIFTKEIETLIDTQKDIWNCKRMGEIEADDERLDRINQRIKEINGGK